MPRTPTFQSIYKFSEDDLAANRSGHLSLQQVQRLKRSARSVAMVVFWFSVFIVTLLTVLLVGILTSTFVDNRTGSPQYWVILPLITPIVFWLIFVYALLRSARTLIAPRTPTLRTLSGQVVLGNKTASSSTYEIEVAGQSLMVPTRVYKLFDQTSAYAIYKAVYGPNDSGTIVAIEDRPISSLTDAKSPLDYEREQLQRIFKFTDADLALNAAGQISPSQIALRRKDIGNGVGCGLFIGAIFGVFPLIFITAFTRDFVLAIGVTAAVIAVAVLLSVSASRGQQRALNVEQPKMVSGTADVQIKKIHHSGKNSHTETVYYVQIGEMRFRVNSEEYYAFKEGKPYRVYYMPNVSTESILSAEQIG